ncbi:MAG: NAD(+) diphosphatase [Sporichthyaceae bacterium]
MSGAAGGDRVLNRLRLSQGSHDRASALRTDAEAIERAWTDPRAKVLRVHESSSVLLADGSDLALVTPGHFDEPVEHYFLGFDDAGMPFFAVHAVFEPAEDERRTHLREISSRLGGAAAGLFVHAVGLANWHARHAYCPNCGGPSVAIAAGHVRRCEVCATQQFPRSDPAVIMLVIDDDERALLGHNPAWPPGRFSTLAGFVEPGESLEQAVVREVFEEVGVRVDHVSYQGSQPWPFPASLMVGFHARAQDTRITVDAAEITEARWFTRAEIVEAGRSGSAVMPGPISIARWLIERWLGAPLPTENRW